MEITQELLKNCMTKLRDQALRYEVYDRYYRGQHDIITNYTENENRSNMKVVVNFFRKFINDEIAYSLGNPVNFISRNDDLEMLDIVDLNFSHWEKVHNQLLAKKTAIFGHAYEVDYINKDGEFRSTVLTPLNCFVIESGSAEKNVILAIHSYRENGKDKLDVYSEDEIRTYLVLGDSYQLETKKEHLFDRTPVRVNEYNDERQSMLDDLKTINDAYNNIISDITNEISDFRTALLRVTGAVLEEKDVPKMKKSGVIQVPNKAVIDYLVKNINDSFIQNTLRTHEEKLYKISSHVDTNEKLQSNLSGTALRSRMIALENKCTLLQSLLEQTIKGRMRNFFGYIQISEGVQYDYRQLKLKFTMNIPHDLNLMADTISKLKDTVSQVTLLSMLPNIENPEAELQKFYAEQKAKREMEMEGMIDLQNLGLNNQAVAGQQQEGAADE